MDEKTLEAVSALARKFALKNASDYGKADAKAILGKILAGCPDAKKDMKTTLDAATAAAAEANAMDKPSLGKALAAFEFEKPRKEEQKKVELPNAVQGKVVTRFPPEPNGFMHIGHAKAVLLGFDAAKNYGGKFLVRWDDSNPEKEKEEYVDAIRRSLEWLGITPDGESYVSDDMEKLYGYGLQMIKAGKAYVCFCPQAVMKELRAAGKDCDCRKKTIEENVDEWQGMLNGRYRHNQAVVRFSGDMASLNTVMRDPVLFRILDATHYRQKDKYKVWPTYDFEGPVEDSITGVTHAMRSKEYELRDELYYAVLDCLGLRKPVLVEFSRLSIKGMPISKRLLKALIEDGSVMGWDDPRLPTLAGLQRRGITAEAVRNFVRAFGLSKVESEPPIDRLLVENKRMVEPIANHYFFVPTPVRLRVRNAPGREVKLRRHPTAENGLRTLVAKNDFYIPKRDADALAKGETFRLKDLYNCRVADAGTNFVEAEYVSDEGAVEKKIQWVPQGEQAVAARLLVLGELLDDNEKYRKESLETLEGYCEQECRKLKKGDMVQFERIGFAILDDEKRMSFILTSK
ncbi:MAG: glutamate--tRNA ligase [Candidatus Micrarchaeia archaeon]